MLANITRASIIDNYRLEMEPDKNACKKNEEKDDFNNY
jgi:hypothetical protein